MKRQKEVTLNRFQLREYNHHKKINQFMQTYRGLDLNQSRWGGYHEGGYWFREDENGVKYFYRYYKPSCASYHKRQANRKVRHNQIDYRGKTKAYRKELNADIYL